MSDGFATSDYDYELPHELIAQDPLADRASSRLMVMDRKTGAISHHTFKEIASFLKAGDLLVLNDTRVIPARLHGIKKDTGAKVEVLLLKEITPHPSLSATRTDRRPPDVVCAPQGEGSNSKEWECLVHPGKKLRKGAEIVFISPPPLGGRVAAQQPGEGDIPLTATVIDILDDGNRLIRFNWDNAPDGRVRSFEEILDTLGEMPLPPYITHKLQERDRYNTVYAKYDGSAAAPTAGLHFTPELLEEVKAKGVNVATVTLHVGLGTFRPVKVDDVREHKMHSEWYHIPEETARLINETKQKGGRVICVGTTSCRTLESAVRKDTSPGCCAATSRVADDPGSSIRSHRVSPGDSVPSRGGQGETDIFIYPGYDFRVMDGLITNFHLPQSTLLMLVSAFATREHVLSAYAEAVRERYRFFSFGDAMLIL